MGDEDRAVVEQKHRTQIKKEPRRASSRREDARPNVYYSQWFMSVMSNVTLCKAV